MKFIHLGAVVLAALGCFGITPSARAQSWVASWTGTTTGLSSRFEPGFLAISGNNLYVEENSWGLVHVLTPLGIVIDTTSVAAEATGVAVDSQGRLYVADYGNNNVQVFSSAGVLLSTWGGSPSMDNGHFNRPVNVAVAPGDTIYVVDQSNNRIQVFDRDGMFIRKWGSVGSGPGDFETALGIAVDSSGFVYVGDTGSGLARIQKFTRTGLFIMQWGSPGTGDGHFSNLSGITVDSYGFVYTTEKSTTPPPRVQVFSSSGVFRTKWGEFGSGPGQFDSPLGIAVDSDRNVYVADSGNHRIQKFSPVVAGVVPAEHSSDIQLSASPNPSVGRTTLGFSLPQTSGALLVIYDLLGRRVAEWQWATLSAGPHQVEWDGLAADGQIIPAGMLFSRLTIGSSTRTEKLVRLQ